MIGPLAQLLFKKRTGSHDASVLRLAVKLSGGTGDAVVIARWLRDYLGSLQCNYSVDIYFKDHRTAKFIFAGIRGVRAIYDDLLFDALRGGYDLSYYANQFVDNWLGTRKEVLVKFDPFVLNSIATVWRSRQKWKKFTEQHPHFDGAFSNLAVLQGHTRETFLHAFTGVPYGGPRLEIASDEAVFSDYPELNGPYITVHDGWDATFAGLFSRPTKALMKDDWPRLVEKVKQLMPIKVVQIGGLTGAAIDGVDLNLKGVIPLKQAAAVLRRSLLHIDTESGLVHLAAALGTKSLVLFGPTNMAFFAYKENINVPPNRCGNCWWSTDDWMQACPAKYDVPICMQTHDLDKIARLAAAEVASRPVTNGRPASALTSA